MIPGVLSLRVQLRAPNLRAWISGSHESCNPDTASVTHAFDGPRVDRNVRMIRMSSDIRIRYSLA